ncbi:hypothetical protein MKX41_09025 [Paenibacillus sp. FSL R5-0475]|uniref:hypothetical protein n=1 Tax=Paenibacillus sp. FSL R5-0475 TaxID=2921643 RepID=UPI0030F7822C
MRMENSMGLSKIIKRHCFTVGCAVIPFWRKRKEGIISAWKFMNELLYEEH